MCMLLSCNKKKKPTKKLNSPTNHRHHLNWNSTNAWDEMMCSLAGVNTHYQTNCVFLYPCFFNVYYTFCIISYQILKPLLPPLNKKTHSFHYFYSSSFFYILAVHPNNTIRARAPAKRKKAGPRLVNSYLHDFIFILFFCLKIFYPYILEYMPGAFIKKFS